MDQIPEFLAAFQADTGVDPSSWQAWRTPSLISVSGIADGKHAIALRDYFVREMGMAAELNDPLTENDTWGVVAVPLTPLH